MNYTITFEDVFEINLSPETEIAEIVQNIKTILASLKNSVPLDRDFGLSGDYIDKPYSIAKSMILAETADAIEKNEPRARLIRVNFSQGDIPGKLITSLEVEINAGR